MKQAICAAALSVVVLFASSPAIAEEYGVGPYIGGGVAHVKAQDYCDTGNLAISNFSCEDAEIGFKIFGGIRPVENFGLEAGFASAEGFKVSGSISGTAFTGETEYYTLYLAGVGVFPIGDNFAATGKVGMHTWEQDGSLSISGSTFSLDADGTDPLFGVGAEFRPTDNIVLQTEWIRFLGEDGDVDAISGNFALAF